MSGISIVSQMKVSRDGIAPLRSKNGEYASFASVSMGNVRRWQCAPSAPMSASSTEESTEAKFLGSRMCRTGKVGGSSPKECVSLRSPRNEIQTNDSRVEAQSLRILAHRRDVLPLARARKCQRSSRRSVRSGHLGVAIECGKLTSNPSSALTRYSFTCWTGEQARAVYVEGGMKILSS